MKIYFVNDKKYYNILYRASLLNIVCHKMDVVSIGYFDSFFSFFKCIFILFSKCTFFSSNLKSNILCMLFSRGDGVVLFNGIGRFRRYKLLRLFLLFLMSFNSKCKFIFQNYADYRFFHLYSNNNVFWVPGSGGVKLQTGVNKDSSGFSLVSRNGKFDYLLDSLSNFVNEMPAMNSCYVVGCTDDYVKSRFMHKSVYGLGYVDQQDILLNAHTYLHLSGYGDGIPKSLLDALVSGLPIILERTEFIRFGFYKLCNSNDCTLLFGSWLLISPSVDFRNTVSKTIIDFKYFDIIKNNK